MRARIAWEDVRAAFAPDGTWRDLSVFDTDLADWQAFLDMIRHGGVPMRFSVDGEHVELPRAVADVFALREGHRPLLRIAPGGLDLACHFFTEDELELDLDPGSVDERRFDDLVELMVALGDVLGKDVVLTYESAPALEILRYARAAGRVSIASSNEETGSRRHMTKRFECGSCRRPQLRIVASKDIGADSRSDEVAIQVVECEGCGFRGIAVYEESRRGADESWHHTGYVVSHDVCERVSTDIRSGSCRVPSEYLAGDEPSFRMRS